MRDDLALETERLNRSWSRHEALWLREYLVSGVEDPRLNVQSIVARHFLVQALFEDAPGQVMAHEYAFAATLNWLVQTPELLDQSEVRAAALHALKLNADDAEGLALPLFVRRAFLQLPASVVEVLIPNYLETFLRSPIDAALPGQVLDTFAHVWKAWLRLKTPHNPEPSLLEPACGSANDYRFLHSYGLAPFLRYTGFDLCAKNIANARELFPSVSFEPGNVFEIAAPDQTFDLCMVHDLFEHLSLAGMEQAVREVCRVTRQALCIGFFQMDEIPDHLVRPTEEYHWNLLAVGAMKRLFAKQGFAAQVLHIDTFLSQQTGGARFHNPNAYTLVLRRA